MTTGTNQRTYYTLVARDKSHSVYSGGRSWGVEFGDWDKRVVKDELACFKSAYNYRSFEFKIITTNGTQAAIDKAVRELNQ